MTPREDAVFFIGGGFLSAARIRHAREIGYRVLVSDMDAQCIGAEMADRFYQVSRTDIEGMKNAIFSAQHIYNVRAAYSGIDIDATMNAIRPLVSQDRPCPDLSLCASKLGMKTRWMDCGIPTPRFQIVLKNDFLPEQLELELPLFVKPLDSSGSAGVSRVDDPAQLMEAIRMASIFTRREEILIEEAVEGRMLDLNGLWYQGEFHPAGCMDRLFFADRPGMSRCNYDPSDLDGETLRKAFNAFRLACEAVGLTDGPAKADAVVRNGEVYLLEIAPRFHGDIQTSYTSPEGPGINAIQAYLASCRGEDPRPYLEKKSDNVAGWRLLQSSAGRVTSISGVDEAQAIPGIRAVLVRATIGMALPELVNNAGIAGFMVAAAENRVALDAVFEKALPLVKIATE